MRLTKSSEVKKQGAWDRVNLTKFDQNEQSYPVYPTSNAIVIVISSSKISNLEKDDIDKVMNRCWIFIFLLLQSIIGMAQVHEESHWYPIDLEFTNSSFEQVQLPGPDPETIRDYLTRSVISTASEELQLKLISSISSPGAQHHLFQQTWDSIPLYGAYVKVNVSKDGKIYALFDGTKPVKGNLHANFPESELLRPHLASRVGADEGYEKLDVRPVYFPTDQGYVPSLSAEVLTSMVAFEIIINNSGELLYEKDLIRNFQLMDEDSLVSAGVFLPDPLTTAKMNYGAPYADFNDSNVAVLNAQIKIVQVSVNYDNGTFSLESPYVKITNYRNPNHIPATSNSPSFLYNRAEQEFEDINVYYHIHTFQEYIQSLGFSNLANYQIHAETHASAADNSTFVGSASPPRLNFGEGGVDDGEDADVIIHEYGHAIQTSASPNTVAGFERKALDEGNSDYLAASYSRALDPHEWGRMFSWDGHNEFFAGRVVDSPKHYPEDLGVSFHLNGEIWASALMEIWTVLGPQATDEIFLQSLYNYAPNMNMSEAATVFLLSDSLLNDGANHETICAVFNARGFSTICNNFVGIDGQPASAKAKLTIVNSANFSSGETVTVRFGKNIAKGTLFLRDLTGKVHQQIELRGEVETLVEPRGLSKGLYILTLETGASIVSEKLVR